MAAEKEGEVKQQKRTKKRGLKITLLVLAVLILLLILTGVIGVPSYISSDSGRKFILSKANASVAGTVDFAKLTMGWVKGISVSDISFKDRESGVEVAVKEFSTKPNYGALLTGGLSFGETVIDEPMIEIDIDKLKQRTSAAPKVTGKSEGEGGQAAGVPIKAIDLAVNNGGVRIKGRDGVVNVSQINSRVNLRAPGEQTKFEIGANVAGRGEASSISAKGQVKPGKDWGLKGTDGNLTVEVNNLELGSLESILAVAGIEVGAKGVLSANLEGAIKDGSIEKVSGKVKGSGLEVTATQLNGDKLTSSVLDIEVEAKQSGDMIDVEKLSVRTDWLRAEASGTAPMSAENIEELVKPDSKYELKGEMECDIPAIAAQLPKTLGLKEQTKVTGGRLAGSVQTLSEADGKKLYVEMKVEGLSGIVDGKSVSLSAPIAAKAKIGEEDGKAKFEDAGVTSSFANVSCSGTMAEFDYDAAVDLANLSSELGQFLDLSKYNLSGQITSKGYIGVENNVAVVNGSVNIWNMRISPGAGVMIWEPEATVDIDAAIDKAKGILSVKQLDAATSFGQFDIIDGRIAIGEGAKGPASLTASARGVDLTKLQPYLVMSKAISKDVTLGGIAESDVTLDFKDGIYRLTTETTKISKLLIKTPGKQAFMQETVGLVLDAEANPAAKSWNVHKLEITSPNIKVKGTFARKAEGQTTNLQGKAELDYDWQTLSNMLSAFMPSELSIEGKRKDAISFSSTYPTEDKDAMLSNMDAQAKVGFEKAEYMGLNMGVTEVDLQVQKGLLKILPFTTTANNGKLSFGGEANFKERPTLFRMGQGRKIVENVEINDDISNKLLARINPLFSDSVGVSGVANFECEKLVVPIKGGAKEDVDIAGTISLTDLNMRPTGILGTILSATGASRGQEMAIQPTRFEVKDGYASYDNMQLDIGDNPVNFSGIVPLEADEQFKKFTVTLPWTVAGRTVRTGDESREKRFTAYMKGTPRHPELDLGKMLQDQLIDTGLNILFDKMKKN